MTLVDRAPFATSRSKRGNVRSDRRPDRDTDLDEPSRCSGEIAVALDESKGSENTSTRRWRPFYHGFCRSLSSLYYSTQTHQWVREIRHSVMSLIRFVHSADLHLDSPFQGLAAIHPDIAGRLQRATFDAYDNIISLCIEERVDALLVAGDVFDGADRSLRAQHQFVEGLKRLDEAGIRSFICHGNHDPLDGWEARLDFPPGAVKFGPEVERAPVFPEQPDRAVVYGVSYPTREVRQNLIPGFGTAGAEQVSIGLVHANVGTDTGHDSYAPCTLGDLEDTGFDYWALGHVHTRRVLRQADPTVVYPGNPQGRHPNERDARGVYLVEVGDSGVVHIEFRPMDVVRWASVQIDIAGLETEGDLLGAIDDALTAHRNAANGRSLVVRIELNGRGDLHGVVTKPEFADGLRDIVNESWVHQTPFLWCERIRVSTASAFDREQRRQGADFLADLLGISDELRDDPKILAKMRELLSDIYVRGNSGRYLRDFLPSDQEIADLISSAEELCLAELLQGEGG